MDRLTNPMVDCEETIKQLDLLHWKEDPSTASTSSSSSSSSTPSSTTSFSTAKFTNTSSGFTSSFNYNVGSAIPNSISSLRTTCKVNIFFIAITYIKMNMLFFFTKSRIACNFTSNSLFSRNFFAKVQQNYIFTELQRKTGFYVFVKIKEVPL